MDSFGIIRFAIAAPVPSWRAELVVGNSFDDLLVLKTVRGDGVLSQDFYDRFCERARWRSRCDSCCASHRGLAVLLAGNLCLIPDLSCRLPSRFSSRRTSDKRNIRDHPEKRDAEGGRLRRRNFPLRTSLRFRNIRSWAGDVRDKS